MKRFDSPIEDPNGKKIIGIADSDRIEIFYDMDLYGIFCMDVLGYESEEILLTDLSSLTDFPEEREYYIDKIRETFKIDVSDLKHLFIVDILQRILDTRESKF